MKTKKANIVKQRESYATNGSLILKKAAITEFEYNEAMFKIGVFFLEELYPDNESYYRKFAYSKSFWNWWYAEWKKFETEFVGYLYENKTIPTKIEWQMYMYQMAFDYQVECNYHNQYLKFIYDGRI